MHCRILIKTEVMRPLATSNIAQQATKVPVAQLPTDQFPGAG